MLEVFMIWQALPLFILYVSSEVFHCRVSQVRAATQLLACHTGLTGSSVWRAVVLLSLHQMRHPVCVLAGTDWITWAPGGFLHLSVGTLSSSWECPEGQRSTTLRKETIFHSTGLRAVPPKGMRDTQKNNWMPQGWLHCPGQPLLITWSPGLTLQYRQDNRDFFFFFNLRHSGSCSTGSISHTQ